MFGFGWVRTHLGDVFLKSIRVFFWFLVGFLEKRDEISKFGIFGVLRCDAAEREA